MNYELLKWFRGGERKMKMTLLSYDVCLTFCTMSFSLRASWSWRSLLSWLTIANSLSNCVTFWARSPADSPDKLVMDFVKSVTTTFISQQCSGDSNWAKKVLQYLPCKQVFDAAGLSMCSSLSHLDKFVPSRCFQCGSLPWWWLILRLKTSLSLTKYFNCSCMGHLCPT